VFAYEPISWLAARAVHCSGMGRNTAEIHVGRLLEVRIDAGYRTIPDVDALFTMLTAAVKTLPPETRHVAIVDWRRCPIMSPDCAAHLLQNMVSVNERTDRSATVAPNDAPTSVLQFARLIRDSNHPHRRMFAEAAGAMEWLDEVLTPEERQRLRRFVSRT
jgi:hypothetical protein